MGADITQLATRIAVMVAVFAVTLFLPAGTFFWPAAWVFLVLFFGFTAALSLWLLRFSPALVAERMTGIGKPDQKTWDKLLLGIMAVAFFAWLAAMELDAVSFRLSQVPFWLQGLGSFLLLVSFYLFFLTFRENA